MGDIWNIFVNTGELNAPVVDVYKRVPTIFNSGKILQPTVSEYVFSKGFSPVYPGNKSFAVAISHDIDSLAVDDLDLIKIQHFGGVKSSIKLLKDEIINSIRIKTKKRSKNYIPKGLSTLLEISKVEQIPSSYYFLSLMPGEKDYNYDVTAIKHIFEQISELGCEIGLHGGHEAFDSAGKMLQEKAMLEKASKVKIYGYRNHYLKFDRKKSWKALEESCFLYDTTYGDAYSPGFRNGMCYPFQPYNQNSDGYMNIVELPLIYMDDSPKFYLHLDDENAWLLFCDLVEKTRRVNGVFTFLWHNTSLDEKGTFFYRKAIDHLKKMDPWFATGKQIVEHYQQNNYLQAINDILTKSKNERAQL